MKKRTFTKILLVVVCACAPAWAGSVLEFPIGRGGRITHGTLGGHDFVSGNGIGITELIYGTEVLPILMGTMNFEINRSGKHDWGFGPGGQFTVTGCVNQNGDCSKNELSTLMTGTFLSAKVVREGGQTILIAKFLEKINPELAALLKLPSTKSEGELELVLVGSGDKSRWVLRGELTGFPSPNVPEPPSVLLLASGLVGLAALAYSFTALRSRLLAKNCRAL